MALEQVHGVDDLLIGAVAAAGVSGLLEALDADDGHEVLHAQHVLAELLVDEGGVGEAHEDGVVMLLAELNEVVLANQGLAAGVDIEIGAHFLALLDDAVDLVEGQVQLVAVLSSPAALAVQVAGRGGVEQDGPGHVAVVLVAVLVLLLPAGDAGVEEEVGQQGLGEAQVHLGHHTDDQTVGGGVLVVDGVADRLALAGERLGAAAGELIDHVHDVGQVLDGVLLDVIEGLVQCKFLDAVA